MELSNKRKLMPVMTPRTTSMMLSFENVALSHKDSPNVVKPRTLHFQDILDKSPLPSGRVPLKNLNCNTVKTPKMCSKSSVDSSIDILLSSEKIVQKPSLPKPMQFRARSSSVFTFESIKDICIDDPIDEEEAQQECLSAPLANRELKFCDMFDDDTTISEFPSFKKKAAPITCPSSRSGMGLRSSSDGFRFISTVVEEEEELETFDLLDEELKIDERCESQQIELTLPPLSKSKDPVFNSGNKHKRFRSSTTLLTQSTPFNMSMDEIGIPTLGRTHTGPATFGGSSSVCVSLNITNEEIIQEKERMIESEKLLPHFTKDDGTIRVTPQTTQDLINGKYKDTVSRFIIFDCRYFYEYDGGHIKGAVNIHDKKLLKKFFNANCDLPYPIVVLFHCEYSQHRGPAAYKYLRRLDRELNEDNYPKLCFPNMYVVDGGYIKYYEQFKQTCIGAEGYISMWDERFDVELKRCHSESWCSRKQVKRKIVRKRFASHQWSSSGLETTASGFKLNLEE